jgi:hypothetical protein
VPRGTSRLSSPDPTAVRLAAAALPVAAFAAGLTAPIRRRVALATVAWAGIVPLTAVVLAGASRRAVRIRERVLVLVLIVDLR